MVKLSSIRLDPKAEVEGVWCTFAPGLEFKIARVGSAPYRAANSRVLAPYARRSGTKWPEERELRNLTAPAVARHLVKDWRGLEAEDGTAIPFSVEECEKILRDPVYDELYTWVLASAGDSEQYREEVQKELSGN